MEQCYELHRKASWKEGEILVMDKLRLFSVPCCKTTEDKAMTMITIDDELINEIIAVSHYENPQKAVIKILSNYLQQQKKELPLFGRLRFIDNESAEDDIASLFERNTDTGMNIEL